jgi:hypothetical protein
MKTLLTLALAAVALRQSAPAKPQTVDAPKTMAVERPVLEAARRPIERYDLARTGIEWHRGLEAALHKGKPVLLFQLLGNFDDVYC